MPEWMPNIPPSLPNWILWVVVIITCVGWIIGKISQWSIWSSSETQNEKDTISILKDKVQTWKNEATELQERLDNKESKTEQIEDKGKTNKNTEPQTSQKEPNEIEEKTEDTKKTKVNNAFEEFRKGNYRDGLEIFKKAKQEKGDENLDNDFLAFAQYTAFKNGSDVALTELEKQNQNNPADANIATWLAFSYKFIERNAKAKVVLEEAVNKSNDELALVSAAKHLAMIYIEEEDINKALSFYKDLTSRISSKKGLAEIYKSVGNIHKNQNNYEEAFMFYEHSLLLNPQNTDLRFDVALLYSQNSAPKFALHHYRKILQFEENKMARNNAGVAAANLSLPIISTKYYREAKELGNTLAASNIAYKLIDAGFVENAEDILKSAAKEADVDKKVYAALANIDERKENENENLDNILTKVSKIKKWRQKFGGAVFKIIKNPTSLSGVYKGKPGKVKLNVTEKGDLSGELFLQGRDEPAELKGQLEGSGIKFSWKFEPKKKKKKDSNKSDYKMNTLLSNLASTPRHHEGLLIVSDNSLQGFSKKGNESLDAELFDFIRWDLNKVNK